MKRDVIAMMDYIGDKAYYRGLFKIYDVKILAKESLCNLKTDYPSFYYMYLIEFDNGKRKYVSSERLVFE